MTAGRIETYIHSDKSTENKGVAVVGVYCQTDFAAKTLEFISFCKSVAMFVYAASALDIDCTWDAIAEEFPEIESTRRAVEAKLKETITINDHQICVVKLGVL